MRETLHESSSKFKQAVIDLCWNITKELKIIELLNCLTKLINKVKS